MRWIWGEGLGGARPVGAPSLKSEILGWASIECSWWAAPPRLSPTLKGSGHPGFAGGDFA